MVPTGSFAPVSRVSQSGVRVAGWAKHLPDRVLTNEELSKTVDTNDEWIRSRTGIAERRIARDDESASSLGIPAARQALELANIEPAEVDLIVCATATPDRIFPSTASLIQYGLGANRAAAFDLGAACSGFIYALVTAAQFIRSGAYRNAVVVGSEIYSRILDWNDRSTCVLFGDGAGAVVLRSSEDDSLLSFSLGSDGSGADLLYVPCATGPVDTQPENGRPALRMQGGEVYKFAVNSIVSSVNAVTAGVDLAPRDIDLIICHQANERILRAAAKQLGVPSDRFYQDLQRYGNTSAASIPIAITEAVEEGRLVRGDIVALAGFGGGLAWGATLLRW